MGSMRVALITLFALGLVGSASATVAFVSTEPSTFDVAPSFGAGRISGLLNSQFSGKLSAVVSSASTGSLQSESETSSATASHSVSRTPLPFCHFYGRNGRIYDLTSLIKTGSDFYTATGTLYSSDDTINFNVCGPSHDPACPDPDVASCIHRTGNNHLEGVFPVGQLSQMSFDDIFTPHDPISSSYADPNQLIMLAPGCATSSYAGHQSITIIRVLCNPEADPATVEPTFEYLPENLCGFAITMHAPAGCAVGETSTASYSETATATSTLSESATASPTFMPVQIFVSISSGPNVLVAGETSHLDFTLSTIASFDVVIHLQLAGTAVVGTDYTITSHKLTIPAGSSSGSVTITCTTTQAARHLSIYIGTTTVPLVDGTPTNYGFSLFGLIPSSSATPTASSSSSPSESATTTPTPSTTSSLTHSLTRTRSLSSSNSRTPSRTNTPTRTPSITQSPTNTPTSGVIVSVSANTTGFVNPGAVAAVTCTLISPLVTIDLAVPFSLGGTPGLIRNVDYTTTPATGGYIIIPAGRVNGSLYLTKQGSSPNCAGVPDCKVRVTVLLAVPSHISSLVGNVDPLFYI